MVLSGRRIGTNRGVGIDHEDEDKDHEAEEEDGTARAAPAAHHTTETPHTRASQNLQEVPSHHIINS